MFVPVSPSIGLPALFALVLGESAGLPLPGETALIASGGLAATGQVPLAAVIVVAALAAILGDTIGYWVGRRGGRKLLLRDGRFASHRRSAVAKADRYFAKYGVITVFFARFIPGVRVVGAVSAGATRMPWRSFAIANALGCITWATTVSSIAYVAGPKGALVMIIIGFSIAGVGALLTWRNVRAADDPLADDPLLGLEEYARSIPRTQPSSAGPATTGPSGKAPAVKSPLRQSGGSPAPSAGTAAALAACTNRP